ncbi:ABC transporter permease [Sphingobacterium griseoflavum]|uniref:Transport permease protein n=1 Tax=Sphingobacterium griseoflavum TaxID=1474952 RepID=A0ABQ3HRR4_9SPHI|nr:ABC transporter permease [Sphingobacterium griseoflavum]GHE28790.1 transport permease protein [Sphingobacterium griseoflavum]
MNWKALLYNTYLDSLAFFRVKIALFFSFLFPLMLFVIFCTIWGRANSAYIEFLLPGMIVLMSISEGLFSVGPVIKDYYASGMIKLIKFLPVDIALFFISFICSRLVFFLLSVLLLLITAKVFFDYSALAIYPRLLAGSILSLVTFSLLGLCISFLSKKDNSRTLSNIVYFILIFIGNLFYATGIQSGVFRFFQDILPTNHLVAFMRSENFNLLVVFAWIVVLAIAFRLLFLKIRYSRS